MQELLIGAAVIVLGGVLLSFVRRVEKVPILERDVATIAKTVESHTGHHAKHFDHATQTEIHQHSMDERLIRAEFTTVNQRIDGLEKNVNQRIDGMEKLVDTKMDNLCDRISDLTTEIKNGKKS